jgi:D-aminopeptidase
MALDSSANVALPGQPVTFTATLDGQGTPTGSVTFEDGTTVLGSAPLTVVNGLAQATFTTSALTAGNHDITAVYDGDDTFAGTSASLTQLISQETTSSLSLTSSPLSPQPGQAVTFTATVSDSGGTPTGTVTFLDGTSVIGTGTLDANGQAMLTTSALYLGSQTITAIYDGDSTYASSSASLTQQVNQVGSSTFLSSSATNAQPGQTVTFTATLTGQDSGTPTGTVTFYDGSNVLGTGSLAVANGHDVATFSTSTLALGSHDIVAMYSGDSTYSDSDGSLTQNVSLSASTTSLSSSANPVSSGQPVTFTATLTGQVSGTPTGTVTFLDGTTVLGTGTLAVVNGQDQATFTTSTLTSGNHTITAIYGGDGTYNGSSAAFPQTVGQGSGMTSSTWVTSSSGSAQPGQSVTFTASVMGMGGTPTGSVTFMDGTTVLGTGTLGVVNGQAQATFTTSTLGLGTHNIIAIYSGDSSFNASQAALTQTVSLAATSVSLSSSASTAAPGQAITFTALLTSMGAGTPTGTVTFMDGNTVLGTGTLSVVNGQAEATFTTSGLELGSDAIVAIYDGDSTFAGSSGSLTETISQTSTSLSLSSSAGTSQPGQAVTFTAQVTDMGSSPPTGTVTFMDGDTVLAVVTLSVVNGIDEATFTTSVLGLGKHHIVAIYSGDDTYASSAASFDQTISTM